MINKTTKLPLDSPYSSVTYYKTKNKTENEQTELYLEQISALKKQLQKLESDLSYANWVINDLYEQLDDLTK